MNRGMAFFAAILVMVCGQPTGASPQVSSQKSKPVSGSVRFGAVRGRVFAVTKGGDLKPGRFAQVYLLFTSKIVGHKVDPAAANDETPGLIFLEKMVEQRTVANNELQERTKDISSSQAFETFACKSELLAFDRAILATLEWSQAGQRRGEVFATDADEEGDFAFTKVKSGKFYIIARGRAGSNDVVWKQDLWIQPGEVVTSKVADVETSCGDAE